jgi:hypothetical protein
VEQAGVSPVTLTVRGVGKVRFRYHDGKEWRTTFDSRQAHGLPVAIEISVWFAESIQESAESTDSGLSAGDEASEAGNFGDSISVIEVPPDRVRIFAVPDGVQSGGTPREQPFPAEEGAAQ